MLNMYTENSIFNTIQFFKNQHHPLKMLNISNLDFCDKIYKIKNKKIIDYKL